MLLCERVLDDVITWYYLADCSDGHTSDTTLRLKINMEDGLEHEGTTFQDVFAPAKMRVLTKLQHFKA